MAALQVFSKRSQPAGYAPFFVNLRLALKPDPRFWNGFYLLGKCAAFWI